MRASLVLAFLSFVYAVWHMSDRLGLAILFTTIESWSSCSDGRCLLRVGESQSSGTRIVTPDVDDSVLARELALTVCVGRFRLLCTAKASMSSSSRWLRAWSDYPSSLNDCSFAPNVVILLWTSDELSHVQAGRRRQRQYPESKTGLG